MRLREVNLTVVTCMRRRERRLVALDGRIWGSCGGKYRGCWEQPHIPRRNYMGIVYDSVKGVRSITSHAADSRVKRPL